MNNSTRTRQALLKATIGWAIGFALANALLAYGIATENWQLTRYGFVANLIITPAALVVGFNETRTAWDGRDREVHSSLVGLGIIIAVLGVNYLLI
jgi:hypothetical protein